VCPFSPARLRGLAAIRLDLKLALALSDVLARSHALARGLQPDLHTLPEVSMKHRNVIARSFVLAGALAASATVAGSASAHGISWGPSYERSSTCVQTAVAPGNGYRDMSVRFDALRDSRRGEKVHPIPEQVAVAPGDGYRDAMARYPYQSTSGGPGYRDALVRFDGMESHGNAIATVSCPNLRIY
jgi:hypothetical protein